MPNDKNGGEVSHDKVAQAFGLVIAYICPGFLTLIALQERIPAIKVWLGTAAAADIKTGGFLFAVMGALATSMLLWSIGGYILEDLLFANVKRFKLPEQGVSEEARKQPGVEAAYRDLRDQHYRYYQFQAAMFVVVLIVYFDKIARVNSDAWTRMVLLSIVALFFEVVFISSAYNQLKRYRERRSALCK